MRTQTLILTAVLSVAGAATTMAQVYSVNAVGYVNLTLKAGKFNLIANPLDAGAGNNIVSKLLNGVATGTTVYQYGASGYTINAYDTDLGGWDNANMVMAPGEGFFVLLKGADTTITFVGEVMQGTLSNPLPKGFSLRASQVPQAGKLQADLKFTPAAGDTIYTFDPASGYTIYAFDPDLGGWDPSDPQIAVGQAFWVLKKAAGTWDRTFSVNQ